MDRLRAMAVFVAVSEAGSLSDAARKFGEPLTNISRLLAQLEQHLGFTLIDRTTRRMALTDAGRDYLVSCRKVLEEIANAERRIAGRSNDLSGDISISAPMSFGRLHVLPILTDFLAIYPRINGRLQLVDRIVDLMKEEIDVAVRIGALRASELRAQRVGSVRLLVCAAPGYLDRRGTPQSVAEISRHDCITFDELPSGPRWTFSSKRYGRASVRVRSHLTVNLADAAVAAAMSGAGITRVLSYQAAAALKSGELKAILQKFDDVVLPVHVVYRATRSENSRVREFVRFASQRLRAAGTAV